MSGDFLHFWWKIWNLFNSFHKNYYLSNIFHSYPTVKILKFMLPLPHFLLTSIYLINLLESESRVYFTPQTSCCTLSTALKTSCSLTSGKLKYRQPLLAVERHDAKVIDLNESIYNLTRTGKMICNLLHVPRLDHRSHVQSSRGGLKVKLNLVRHFPPLPRAVCRKQRNGVEGRSFKVKIAFLLAP